MKKKQVYDTGFSLALHLSGYGGWSRDSTLLLTELTPLMNQTGAQAVLNRLTEATQVRDCADDFARLTALMGWTAGHKNGNRLCWDVGAEALAQSIGALLLGRYLGMTGAALTAGLPPSPSAAAFAGRLVCTPALQEPFFKGVYQGLKTLFQVLSETYPCGEQLLLWDWAADEYVSGSQHLEAVSRKSPLLYA